MNGIGFEEFEKESFDSLYSRGFAGAKAADEYAKSSDFKSLMDSGIKGLHQIAGTGRNTGQAGGLGTQATPAGGVTRLPQPVLNNARSQVPLNDMSTMPGNTRVGHATTEASSSQRTPFIT